MTDTIRFFVPGRAAPAGSKKAFYIKSLGRAVITDANAKAAPWRQTVKVFAFQAYQGPLLTGPLVLDVTFLVARPKGHYGTGKNAGRIKGTAPIAPTSKPDATKLLRGTEDALTGILWGDDAQIVDQHARKRYSDHPGAIIEVRPFTLEMLAEDLGTISNFWKLAEKPGISEACVLAIRIRNGVCWAATITTNDGLYFCGRDELMSRACRSAMEQLEARR